jgi:predicted acylesterase/phospholipase RssA
VAFQKRFYRHRGITIIQKRDPSVTRLHPSKVALVLAGGAVSGGGFKTGGLRALDELFAHRRAPGNRHVPFSLTDCDMFVGLSAGSILASVLAAGVSPTEMLEILLGRSQEYEEFDLTDFISLGPRDMVGRLLRTTRRQTELFTNWLSGATDTEEVRRYRLAKTLRKMVEVMPSALPTGLFTTSALGAYLRRNMERRGFPDDFLAAYQRTGKELYLTAVDVNRGEMMVFGYDEPYGRVRISDAVTASCAVPGWYRPVRLKNPLAHEKGEPETLDLVDGGLVRTANVRIAAEKGADLVICYNPFTRIRYERDGRSLVDHGPYALASQLFRILLGARLDLAKEIIYRDESCDVDVVFIEPAEDDYVFFRMNPFRHANRARAAMHGYRAIRAGIEANHARLAEIFQTHGIALHPPTDDVPWLGRELGDSDLMESQSSRGRSRSA